MNKKTYTITEDEYEAIRIHTFNIYSAIEDIIEDCQIIGKNLERIENRENSKSKLIHFNKYNL